MGRTSRADLVFADDNHMSGVHFVVVCDDRGCLVRDLNSSNGTLLNGTKVGTAPLSDGDTVTGGSTTFLVHLVDERIAMAAAPTAPVEAAVATTPQAKLLGMLREEFQPLYALLDAAIEPDVLKVIFESQEEYQSLFEGPAGAQLTHFAPYLVRLTKESPLLEVLVEKGGAKAGAFT